MVCIELTTTLTGGIAEDLTVTLATNVAGTDLVYEHIKCQLQNFCTYRLAGSASANDISVTSPVQITFLSGDAPSGSPMTRCTTDIMIVDDQALEPDETFTVFISGPTECVGPPAFAVVTIRDNDSMYIYIL